MLFNSAHFFWFFVIIFIVYWSISRNINIQNVLIVFASYIFYGWWDYRFLILIFLSTLIDFSIGIKVFESEKPFNRKLFLWISILSNLGMLGFFKYYNFFIESWIELLSLLGLKTSLKTLYIILPVGISFYTFQTLSYTLDIYNKKISPTKDFVAFAAFVSFFPQLVAGPIERASHLLPQFKKKRYFDTELASSGMRLILWGAFKKIVIADNCATFVDQIFSNYSNYDGVTLMLGAILFAFQIYCDFSGYSDIAIGLGRLMGFDIMRNFNYPYFSRNIGEFWQRWHISLSSWFRDYLYIPLGGSKRGMLVAIFNVLIVFIVSGFWHGANWTFVFWGILNGLLYIPLLITRRYSPEMKSKSDSKYSIFKIVFMFLITCILWIFFRSNTISDAFNYIAGLFDFSGAFEIPQMGTLLLIIFFITTEWKFRFTEAPFISSKVRLAKNSYYGLLIILIIVFGRFDHNEFIYFQF